MMGKAVGRSVNAIIAAIQVTVPVQITAVVALEIDQGNSEESRLGRWRRL
jgi:hypothetical protein